MSSTWFRSADRKSIMPGCSGSSSEDWAAEAGAAAGLVGRAVAGAFEGVSTPWGPARFAGTAADGGSAFVTATRGADKTWAAGVLAGIAAFARATALVPLASARRISCRRYSVLLVRLAARAASGNALVLGDGKGGI